MNSNILRHGNYQHTFYIKSGNYAKHMCAAIKSELMDELPWKQQLIWTISKLDFKNACYSQIILIVQEFGSQLTFRTPDDGIAFILTLPELADTAPSRKKWLGIF